MACGDYPSVPSLKCCEDAGPERLCGNRPTGLVSLPELVAFNLSEIDCGLWTNLKCNTLIGPRTIDGGEVLLHFEENANPAATCRWRDTRASGEVSDIAICNAISFRSPYYPLLTNVSGAWDAASMVMRYSLSIFCRSDRQIYLGNFVSGEETGYLPFGVYEWSQIVPRVMQQITVYSPTALP